MIHMSGLFMVLQLVFVLVIGLYFWNMLRQQYSNRSAIEKESQKQKEKLENMRKIS